MNEIKSVVDTLGNVANENFETLGGWEENLRFLGIKIINVSDFTELLVRLAFNLFVSFLVVHYMYARNSRRKDFCTSPHGPHG